MNKKQVLQRLVAQKDARAVTPSLVEQARLHEARRLLKEIASEKGQTTETKEKWANTVIRNAVRTFPGDKQKAAEYWYAWNIVYNPYLVGGR